MGFVGYADREGIAAATNIQNGLLQLHMFPEKRAPGLKMIEQMIVDVEDGGLEACDKWLHHLLTEVRDHLRSLGTAYPPLGG